ncbi:MAG: hypothetical protein R3F37_10645 [Candidatus Competibacteraceae bacterium]
MTDRLRFAWNSTGFRHSLYIVLGIVLLSGVMLGLDRLFPPDLSRAQHYSSLVLDAQGSLLRGFTTADDSWRLPLQSAAVDPLYPAMLTAYEDQRFAWHRGWIRSPWSVHWVNGSSMAGLCRALRP